MPDSLATSQTSLVGVIRYQIVWNENAQGNGSPPSCVASLIVTESEYGSAAGLTVTAFERLSFAGGSALAAPAKSVCSASPASRTGTDRSVRRIAADGRRMVRPPSG